MVRFLLLLSSFSVSVSSDFLVYFFLDSFFFLFLHLLFSGDGKNYSKRVFVLYSGDHYDALVWSPFGNAPSSNDQEIFSSSDMFVLALFPLSSLLPLPLFRLSRASFFFVSFPFFWLLILTDFVGGCSWRPSSYAWDRAREHIEYLHQEAAKNDSAIVIQKAWRVKR
jgi:hypothetical protein